MHASCIEISDRFHRAGLRSGAILLEVILALALFAGAALVIGSGLSRAAMEVERLRAKAHSLDLAVSTLAELQMGIRPLISVLPEPCAPPFEDWTCEIQVETPVSRFMEPTAWPVLLARVTIRHEESGVVQRITQLVPDVAVVDVSEP